jgi:Ca2+-binding RTX toxin-like protein
MRALTRLAATTTLSLAAFAVLPGGTAHAITASSCGINGLNGVSVMVQAGDPVTMSTGPAGEIRLTSANAGTVQCDTTTGGGAVGATTANTRSVAVGGYDDLTIDLHRGTPATYAWTSGVAQTSDRSGIPDIYFVLSSWHADLTIEGSDQADDIRSTMSGGFRLDGDADVDVNLGTGGFVDNVTIHGNGGNDLIDLSSQYGNVNYPFTIDGGAGDDVVHGYQNPDVLDGGAGNDEVVGGLANDVVSGGDGNDQLLEDGTYTYEDTAASRTIPEGGTVDGAVYVGTPVRADRLRVRVSITHPAPQTLTVALQPPGGQPAIPLVTTPGGSGADLAGTVFDDSAAAQVGGNAPYTGVFQPEGSLSAFLSGFSVLGPWSLTVTDTDGNDGKTGEIVGFELALVASTTDTVFPGSFGVPPAGMDQLHGGLGDDTLSYGARSDGVGVQLTGPGSGMSGGEPQEGDSFDGIEAFAGGFGNDYFEGSSSSDTFSGGEGGDFFMGKGGDDTITCGAGEDGLSYLSGATSGVTVDLGAGSVSGGDADLISNDCEDVVGSSFSDTLIGNAEANRLVGHSGNDTITGLGGADTLDPGSGVDAVSGGDGDDVVLSAEDTDADVYDGGNGTDGISFEFYSLPVHVTLDDVANDGTDLASSDNAKDMESVLGSQFDDTITGNGEANVLVGGDGNDVLNGRAGANTLEGGTPWGSEYFAWGFGGQPAGTDTVSYASSATGAQVDLTTGTAVHESASDQLYDIANVIGSSHGDTIVGSIAANVLRPGLGNDTVTGSQGDDTFVAESTPDGADSWDSGGEAGDTVDYSARVAGVQLSKDGIANDGAVGEGDQLLGASDLLVGGLGPDVLIGGALADDIDGGPGADSINGRGGDDDLVGGDGDDVVNGSSGNDHVDGANGNDTVVGGDGDDTLLGSAGNDRLIGSSGDDDAFGGLGDDTFVEGDTAGPNGSDLLRGEGGTDTVSYNGRTAGVKVSLNGTYDDGGTSEQDNASNDIEKVDGTAYADMLVGSSAVNTLRGLGGNDVLNGLTGNDTLDGGTGNDTFATGSAADGKDVYVGGTGVDVADYHLRTLALTVTLDGAANDGQSGELDNVRTDVENVYGGAGADKLFGSSLANRLLGYGGNDQLTGGLGADYLDGGTGNDWFYAKDGVKDTLVGGAGTDALKSYDPTDVRSSVP